MLLPLLFLFFSPLWLNAHRPTFARYPQTIWDKGIKQKCQTLHIQQRDRSTSILAYETWYGINESTTLLLVAPLVFDRRHGHGHNSNLGNIRTLIKHRFYKKDWKGHSVQASLLGGFILPTNTERNATRPFFRTGGFNLIATGVYESPHWYFYSTLEADLYSQKSQAKQSNLADWSLVVFYRPVPVQFDQPDWAVAWETNVIVQDKERSKQEKIINTGGYVLFAGPTFGMAYENIFLKGGMQVPLVQSWNSKSNFDFRLALVAAIDF